MGNIEHQWQAAPEMPKRQPADIFNSLLTAEPEAYLAPAFVSARKQLGYN
jgi:hypothetical protein